MFKALIIATMLLPTLVLAQRYRNQGNSAIGARRDGALTATPALSVR